MADMNREEVDAKIAASEARTDSKFASVLARLDDLIARMDKLEAEMASLKKTMILTSISTVLATVFGVAGFNAALLNNMTASFESGKEMGQWQSEIRKQAVETEIILARVRKQLDADEALQQPRIKQERESERK
jgi:hypothetical protein